MLFGAGERRKLLYRRGALVDALSGAEVAAWEPTSERIDPSEMSVTLVTRGGVVRIAEDETGVWVSDGRSRHILATGAVQLPRFNGHPHAARLRALHHELLTNIYDGQPLPNLLVYERPWYRGAAMVAMCLARTGNLELIAPWVQSLEEPYDRNNAGVEEPDNLGQALYLISLVSDAEHPLVPRVLEAAAACAQGGHLTGQSNFAPHPVYQTKWMKYGLSQLALPDPYTIPRVPDSYSALIWWAYTDEHVPGPRFDQLTVARYPYLGWAEAHFHREAPPAHPADRRPLTWEAEASQADYNAMTRVGHTYAERRVCAPHTWHAAEMFLYLADLSGSDRPV
ncbi:MAG: hypothetical protein RLZZ387_4732 [Chloroflexota bacterium]